MKKGLGAWAVLTAMVVVLASCSGQPKKPSGDAGPVAVGTEPTSSGSGVEGTASPTPGETPSGSPAASPGVSASRSPGTSGGGGGGGSGGGGGGGSGGAGSWKDATLFSGGANRQGITSDSIVICEHAGITLASAFGNDPARFDAYWRMVNDQGGVYGRKVQLSVVDDGYNANQAATAFDDCRSRKPFLIIGGIGYDQIPTVRTKAEAAKELYVYGTATDKGTAGNMYSFAVAPTVEYMGRRFAEAMLKYNNATKIGVLTVSSDGWKGGADTFEAVMKAHGRQVMRREIANNNDVLTSHVVAFEQAGVQAVFANVNALAFSRLVTESDSQSYYPIISGWAFNLASDNFGSTMRKWPEGTIQGLSATPVWDPQTAYAWSKEMARVKSYYEKYYGAAPNDIDWIQWIAMKALHRFLLDCGKDCTRNRMAGMLESGYRGQDQPSCPVDFARGGGRFGGWFTNFWDTIYRGSTVVWRQRETCVDHFG